MIPKTIHYCWFGRGKKNELALKCIESWHKVLPDYKIKEWNEDNFDVTLYPYAKEALESRKYAFVTDVVRLYALYTEGGVYLDTDVEVLKTFDPFLHHHMFSGFENNGFVPTGMMAAEKGSKWAKDLLDEYTDRHFVLENGNFDLTTNTKTITDYMIKQGLRLDNTFQDFPGLCTMYPFEFFCPKDHGTGEISCTANTVCIHHFAGSWIKQNWLGRQLSNLKKKLTPILGGKTVAFLSDVATGRFLKGKHSYRN